MRIGGISASLLALLAICSILTSNIANAEKIDIESYPIATDSFAADCTIVSNGQSSRSDRGELTSKLHCLSHFDFNTFHFLTFDI